MPYCSRCGVEVESGINKCPLCQTVIQVGRKDIASEFNNYPDSVIHSVVDDLKNVVEKKKYVWELVSIFFLISIISVLAINFSLDRELTWSFYPVCAILTSWGSLTAMLFLNRHLFIFLFCDAFFLSLFLFLTDLYSGGLKWFFPIALPIVCLILIIFLIDAFIISLLKTNGLNTAGFLLMGISVFCSGLENILSLYTNGRMSFSWSVVVGFSLIPISGFLIYLHYRFTSGKRYEGWLHF